METTKFDIADYLDSPKMIAEYLNAILEEGTESEIIAAASVLSGVKNEISEQYYCKFE